MPQLVLATGSLPSAHSAPIFQSACSWHQRYYEPIRILTVLHCLTPAFALSSTARPVARIRATMSLPSLEAGCAFIKRSKTTTEDGASRRKRRSICCLRPCGKTSASATYRISRLNTFSKRLLSTLRPSVAVRTQVSLPGSALQISGSDFHQLSQTSTFLAHSASC